MVCIEPVGIHHSGCSDVKRGENLAVGDDMYALRNSARPLSKDADIHAQFASHGHDR